MHQEGLQQQQVVADACVSRLACVFATGPVSQHAHVADESHNDKIKQCIDELDLTEEDFLKTPLFVPWPNY